MILSVDDLFHAAYAREEIERRPLSAEELAEMIRYVPRSDMEQRLKALEPIPEQRCHLSKVQRDLLKRALAAR